MPKRGGDPLPTLVDRLRVVTGSASQGRVVHRNAFDSNCYNWRHPQCFDLANTVSMRTNGMADDLSDLEIAVLCDLLHGPHVNLKAHKRAVLDRLVAKGLVDSVKGEPAIFQLTDRAHHLLAERGVGISGG